MSETYDQRLKRAQERPADFPEHEYVQPGSGNTAPNETLSYPAVKSGSAVGIGGTRLRIDRRVHRIQRIESESNENYETIEVVNK